MEGVGGRTGAPFALGSFSAAGCRPFAGLVVGERVVALTALNGLRDATGAYVSGADSMLGVLENWNANIAAIAAFVSLAGTDAVERRFRGAWTPIGQLRVHPPVPDPAQIICAGANYRSHVIDLAGDYDSVRDRTSEERRADAARKIDERAARGQPYAFIKLPSCLVGAFDDIALPADIEHPDWELELAVVIGRPARRVPRTDAMQYVAGYTVANDVSARERLYRTDLRTIGTDWMSSKSPPTFLPVGPWLVPAAFVPDPSKLRIELRLNGQVMQDARTDDMIFDIPRLIEYVSGRVQLLPGDLLLTGSPAGNGTHHKRFLRPGDVMDGSISGLGRIRNACVAA